MRRGLLASRTVGAKSEGVALFEWRSLRRTQPVLESRPRPYAPLYEEEKTRGCSTSP